MKKILLMTVLIFLVFSTSVWGQAEFQFSDKSPSVADFKAEAQRLERLLQTELFRSPEWPKPKEWTAPFTTRRFSGKWTVREVERDGEKHPAQVGQEVGDVVTMSWMATETSTNQRRIRFS